MNALVLAFGLGALLVSRAPESIKVNDFAPDFEGEWLYSKASSLEDLRGQVVLVDFWRTW